MKLCETCKHWDAERDTWSGRKDKGFGECKKVAYWGDAFDVNDEPQSSKYKDVKAFADDAEGYHAILITHKTYGCVMHEEKNT